MPTVFRIRLTCGHEASTIRWQLYAPDHVQPFLEARRTFKLRDDAFRDAEAFLSRLGKRSIRDLR